jgi:hypothetical protein
LGHFVLLVTPIPRLRPQEIPLDYPAHLNNMFQLGSDKPFVATCAAIGLYSNVVIIRCWQVLLQKANEHNGLDYIQVFEDECRSEDLWFIEEGASGLCYPRITDGWVVAQSV